MSSPYGVRRVILVVLDGLRPDAIAQFGLTTLRRLIDVGSSTMSATSVSPTYTAAAMASLITGVHPRTHGLCGDKFHLPRRTGPVHPLPAQLRIAGIPTYMFVHEIPMLYRLLGTQIARLAGVDNPHFVGDNAAEILQAARSTLANEQDGLFVLHWPDGDRAGHKHGWMSESYGETVREMDDVLGELCSITGVENDPSSVLIALSDHGGGGASSHNHGSDHPDDRTIPIVVAGGKVVNGDLAPLSSIVDVPATVLALFGENVPCSYVGRAMMEIVTPVSAMRLT